MRRLFLFCLPIISFIIIATLFIQPKQKSIGYLKHFKANNRFYERKFLSKIKNNPPSWMLSQIEEDLSFCKRISLTDLHAAEMQMAPFPQILRYRMSQGKVYCSKQKKIPAIEPVEHFQKALLTLAALVDLPDLDFFVNHEDGTFTSLNTQAPVFGWAKIKTVQNLILIPDYRSVSTHWFNDIRKLKELKNFQGSPIPWSQKKSKAFWRGSQTEHFARLKITEISKTRPAYVDAGLTPQTPRASYEEHLQYKYLPVIDGIMCSYPGFQWRLLSDSLALKQESNQIQWFYGALQPYVHYLPIQNDLSNLIEIITWAEEHDDLCQRIVQNATEFIVNNLMFDGVYQYLYLALMQYASHLDETVKQDMKLNTSWTQIK